MLLVRHTFTLDGLAGPEGLTDEAVWEYTRRQTIGSKFPASPPRYWLVFVADGKRRSRLFGAYENFGEVLGERTPQSRYYALQSSSLLASLRRRLVVQWPNDTINWVKPASSGSRLPVVEVADPVPVPFPGFDRMLITLDELQQVIESPRYRSWREVLASVQGVDLITDPEDGRQYVGKADGTERILGRWTAYAQSGHGGNVGLRQLLQEHPERAARLQFSILRVFGPDTPRTDVDASEEHYKRALMSRSFGLNRN